MTAMQSPTANDVRRAAERLSGRIHRTPIHTSSTLDKLIGAEVFFKCEQFQRMGAFKIRGAMNALMNLSDEAKARGVVAYSSGNHAQGIALAARELGIKSVIVMPADAPASKVAATLGYGAEVVKYNRLSEDRLAIAQQLQREFGYTLIPPYDHPDVMAGQGTAALELLEEVGELDALLVPVGGGGLISGTALITREVSPLCKIYGVEPEAGNDGQQSFQAGSIMSIAVPDTIADGAQTQALGKLTFPVIKNLVSDMRTVSDDELLYAMRFLAERMNLVVEPTGCLAAAAVFNMREELEGKRVGVILSGGNVDLDRYAHLLFDSSRD